jgi:hypothetical protein
MRLPRPRTKKLTVVPLSGTTPVTVTAAIVDEKARTLPFSSKRVLSGEMLTALTPLPMPAKVRSSRRKLEG